MNDLELWFLRLLLLQFALGAYDTIVHHELTARLTTRRTAARELAIHATRSGIYAVLFVFFAHFAPTGFWLALVWAVIAIEVPITLYDFRIEDLTRTLPPSERTLHTVLAINAGVMFGLYALATAGAWHLPSALGVADRGLYAIALDLGAIGLLASAVRDALAARALARRPASRPLWAAAPPRSFLIAGATGFIGHALSEGLLAAGHRVTVLSRDPRRAAGEFAGRVRAVASTEELRDDERFDAIVNVAGAPIVGPPWTRARRAELRASRVDAIHELASYCERVGRKPAVWIQAGAIGLYGYSAIESPEHADLVARPGDFASTLCAEIEAALPSAPAQVGRVVVLRMGMVLDRFGGILPPLALANTLGAGSVIGDGAQPFPWIHLDDVLAFVERALGDATIRGPYNLVAPEHSTQRQFADAIARLARRPRLLRVPAFALRLALGEMARLLVEGPRVTPRRLLDLGFAYRHPTLESALRAAILDPPGVGHERESVATSRASAAERAARALRPTST